MAFERPPVFLAVDTVLEYHDEQLRAHGGLAGIRDYAGLVAAVNAPQSRYIYDPHATMTLLAAIYAFRITSNHPFVDGNKRTCLQCALAFLRVNGFELRSSEETLYEWIMMISSGVMGEEQLAAAFDIYAVRLGGFVHFLSRVLFD